ncbi:MAG: hypothetical protein U0V74_10890 [Chitinophagales bacterium]
MKLHIPTPCHEDWDAMTPNEQGAFCKVCSKTVIDFSQMTDEDVIAWFQNKQEEKTCGRFRFSQLSPQEIHIDLQQLVRKNNFSKSILATLFIVFSSLFICRSDSGEPIPVSIVCNDLTNTLADTTTLVKTETEPDTTALIAPVIEPLIMGQTIVPHSIPYMPPTDTIKPVIDTLPEPLLMGKVCVKPKPEIRLMKGEVRQIK